MAPGFCHFIGTWREGEGGDEAQQPERVGPHRMLSPGPSQGSVQRFQADAQSVNTFAWLCFNNLEVPVSSD